MATMHVYDKNKGQSSSLFKPVSNAMFNTTAVKTMFVPVVPMASVINGIAPSIDIWFLMTDMQGYDTSALRAGGKLLERVHYIAAESGCSGWQGTRARTMTFTQTCSR